MLLASPQNLARGNHYTHPIPTQNTLFFFCPRELSSPFSLAHTHTHTHKHTHACTNTHTHIHLSYLYFLVILRSGHQVPYSDSTNMRKSYCLNQDSNLQSHDAESGDLTHPLSQPPPSEKITCCDEYGAVQANTVYLRQWNQENGKEKPSHQSPVLEFFQQLLFAIWATWLGLAWNTMWRSIPLNYFIRDRYIIEGESGQYNIPELKYIRHWRTTKPRTHVMLCSLNL